MRETLRSATALLHARVDGLMVPLLQQQELDGYKRFLAISAAAVLPLERALEDANVYATLQDWPERARSAALLSDLAELSLIPPERDVRPNLGRLEEACQFGVLYVLEGSRLGARAIVRALRAAPGGLPATASRYLVHGEGKPLWQSFLSRLEASSATRQSPDDAIAGAAAAFKLFLPRNCVQFDG